MISVLIVDDHPIVRQGVMQILAETDDIRIEGEAENGDQALERCAERRWDVIILDINMPGRNGIETAKLIRERHPDATMLMLSIHSESHIAMRALKAGAAGYVTKQSVPDQLIHAIRRVHSGRRYITPELAADIADNLGRDVDRPVHELLSNREYQTLCMIASGKTLTQIADDLQISVKTVSVYRTRLLEKLRLKTNAELTHYGIKNQLVDLSQSTALTSPRV
jgi:two-component system invasion response regulator UvrY